MKSIWRRSCFTLAIITLPTLASLGACTGEIGTQSAASTAESPPQTTFAQAQADLLAHCVSCHEPGSPNGVFDSYEALMQTSYIVPGDADASALCTVARKDPPPLPANLPPEVADDICAWIDAGALKD